MYCCCKVVICFIFSADGTYEYSETQMYVCMYVRKTSTINRWSNTQTKAYDKISTSDAKKRKNTLGLSTYQHLNKGLKQNVHCRRKKKSTVNRWSNTQRLTIKCSLHLQNTKHTTTVNRWSNIHLDGPRIKTQWLIVYLKNTRRWPF
jgi:hypothetical protein